MTKQPKQKPIAMAAALQYTPESDNAPRLIAYGKGEVAETIVKVAQENGIPLHQDQALVQLLSHLELGHEIPEEAYQVVAEILAFIYRLSAKNP